jgi:hypothetical protein
VVKASDRYRLWHGRPDPPDARWQVHAGPVTATLVGPDLRHVRVGAIELVERIYVAVRDAPWNTIPATYSDWIHEIGPDRFRVTFRASHRYEAIAFDWAGRIEGHPDGTIRYEMDGTCQGTFQYSKIGFNVHHALRESVGHAFRMETDAGTLHDVLPGPIEPQRIEAGSLTGMFRPFREMAISIRDDVEAVVRLEGDLLELQDHRNWTDANFKSYGTPLSLGFPFDSDDGQRIRQQLTVAYAGPTPPPAEDTDPEVHIGARPAGRLPRLGLGTASHGEPLSAREAGLIRGLRPAHLRVDVHLGQADHAARLEGAIAEARALGTGIELAIHAHERHEPELAALAGRSWDGARIERVLVYPAADGFSAFVSTTPAAIVSMVRRHLEPVVGGVVFAGGTDQSFADVNRERPTDEALTGICFSISPTVHAADDWSIVENLAAQSAVVEMARSFSGGRAICVSPVTLATRFGPYPAGPPLPGDPPPSVDPRQASLLGAAWTVGSIAELATGRADSVTYYETSGWRGVVERDAGSPMPERFGSRPGQVFPLYHVFADLAEWGEGQLLPLTTTRPLDVVGLAVRDPAGHDHALIANVTPDAQRVRVSGLGAEVDARPLDEATSVIALDDPETYRGAPRARIIGRDDGVWLALGPFAVARLDALA